MAGRAFGIPRRLGPRLLLSSSSSTSSASAATGASSSNAAATLNSPAPAPAAAAASNGVGVQEFLTAVGQGVEAHADKIAKEAGSFSNFLSLRGGRLKGLGVPCQQRKIILRFTEKYRQGTWSPKSSEGPKKMKA